MLCIYSQTCTRSGEEALVRRSSQISTLKGLKSNQVESKVLSIFKPNLSTPTLFGTFHMRYIDTRIWLNPTVVQKLFANFIVKSKNIDVTFGNHYQLYQGIWEVLTPEFEYLALMLRNCFPFAWWKVKYSCSYNLKVLQLWTINKS